MAKKVILKDDNVEIMPITRGELILDSSGQLAFHSSQFLATQSLPGLMSGEDKTKLDSLEKVTVEDKKVEQVNTTTNSSYRILFSNSADDTTKTEGARKSAKLLFNPSTGALTATALIGKLNWSNLNNVPENFTPAQHIHNTSEITALTSYSKATSASDLATTDTLNVALGKLEYKADTAYTLVAGAYDGDGTIENLAEILKVLEGIKDTETIQAIVGKYLPLSGGTMSGNITFDVNRLIRWHQSDTYSISCPTGNDGAYLLLKAHNGTTIKKRLSVYKTKDSLPNTSYNLYTDGSLYAASAAFGSLHMGSNDINFKGSDPGDIAWYDESGNETGRIYSNSGILSLRHNAGTTYKILHTGNAGINNGTITIDGVSITPLTSHQSLANYVTLNGNQTISGVKTFSSQQKFTVAQGTSPFTVTSTTKVSNLNADMVDGYNISTAGTTKPWGTIVTIGSDGVSEMGRYIDFHYDNTTGSDYSTRLLCGGNHSNVVTLPSATGTLALTSQIPSALKNPKKLTIFGVEYDGSTDKTVTAVTMISTLSEGSSNITDQTEILTSYASDNGFADTNAPNVVYKRDAVKLYNYINAKLAATYAGLNKTGTVTSVAISNGGGIGISGSPITSSGTIIISNAGVRSTTINGNYLRVNTNGTNTDLTIPYATLSSVVGDGTMNMIPQYNNEINFGGTNAAGNIYFGYRAVDSKPIPTNFIFGGADGSASVKASGFIKKGSSDSYVLLGGGGHKALSDFAMASAYVKKAGDTMTGVLSMKNDVNPRILFIPNSGSNTLGAIYLMGGSSTAYSGIKYKFRQWSYTANSLTRLSYYEDYNLPETPAGLTANASYTILTTKNASVSGGGSSWGSSITVKINGTTKTLTIPANPNTWRGITDSYSGTDSTISLSQKGGNALYNALVNGYASSAGNADTVDNLHASDFVRAYGTYGASYSYDSDWGLSIVTFDPVVSGTYPENNPNITILNLGNNYARRKQLACTYNNNNIYYRRRIDSSWSEWVRLAIAGESYTKGDSDGRYYPISGNVNMSGDNKWIGSTMGGGTDYWRIGGSGTSDNGVCQITIGDNSNDYFQIVIADYTGTNYTALLVKAGGTYAPHFYENSDQRLKTNIQTILNKDNIPQIKEFDWKESGEHSYGLIAQELEDQGYSELVSTKDDGYKTVNYSAALSLIVGKLQVKIKELEKEIEILKKKN